MNKEKKHRSILKWIGNNKLFSLGLFIMLACLIIGIFSPILAPYDPAQPNPGARLTKPFMLSPLFSA